MTKEKLLEEINLCIEFLKEIIEFRSFCRYHKDQIQKLMLSIFVKQKHMFTSESFTKLLLKYDHIDENYETVLELKSSIETSQGQLSLQFCSFISKQSKAYLRFLSKIWEHGHI